MSLSKRSLALATGAVVGSTALLGAAPVVPPPVPTAVVAPATEAHDVALTAGFEDFITGLEVFALNLFKEVLSWFDLDGDTVSELLKAFGLDEITPNELLGIPILGDLIGGANLGNLAGLTLAGENPIAALLAAGGFTDATTLSEAAAHAGFADQKLSDLLDLVGLKTTDTLSAAAAHLQGVGDQPISALLNVVGLDGDDTLADMVSTLGVGGVGLGDLLGLVGLDGDSTMADLVGALGIGDTAVGDLLDDWGVGGLDLNAFLGTLGIEPQELLDILGVDSADLGAVWDSATDSFADGTTLASFADAADLSDVTAGDLLADHDLDGVSLGDAMNTIGLSDASTISDFLDKTSMGDATTIDGLLSGLGVDPTDGTLDDLLGNTALGDADLGSLLGLLGLDGDATVGDLLNVGDIGDTTFGDFLGLAGLTDADSINDLLGATGLAGTTVSELIEGTGVGDVGFGDLADDFYGDTSVGDLIDSLITALGGEIW